MDAGTLTITRFDDPATGSTRLRIDHADPVVWISDELLAEIETGRTHPGIVQWNPAHRTLTIIGENRTVIYRVTDTYEADLCRWLMVWPD